MLPTKIGIAAVLAAGLATAAPAEAAITYKGQAIDAALWTSTTPGARDTWRKIAAAVGVVPGDTGAIAPLYVAYAGGRNVDITDAAVLETYVLDDVQVGLRGRLDVSSVRQFVAQQRRLAEHVVNTPALYEERLVTVGFEHEFLKLHDPKTVKALGADASLCEMGLVHIDHAELVKSKHTLNNLPFLIETDADNELELVTPPFYFPVAAPGVPLPDGEQLAAYRHLMEGHLTTLNSAIADINRQNLPFFLFSMINRLDLGVDWDPQDIRIAPTSWGPLTPVTTSAMTISQLASLCVYSGAKGANLVLTQANVATTSAVYSALQHVARQHKARRWRTPLSRYRLNEYFQRVADLVLVQLNAHLGGKLALSDKEAHVKRLLLELAAACAKQMAVPALQRYAGIVKQLPADKPITWREELLKRTEINDFKDAENLGSHVKDWQGFWLKTSFYNFALSTLSKEEMVELGRYFDSGDFAKAVQLAIGELTKDPKKLPSELDGFTSQEHLQAMGKLPFQLAERWKFGGAPDEYFGPSKDAELGFSDHGDFHVGPRQDTFIGHRKVQRDDLWPRHVLHVVETREDDLGSLTILAAELAHPPATIPELLNQRAWTFYRTTVLP